MYTILDMLATSVYTFIENNNDFTTQEYFYGGMHIVAKSVLWTVCNSFFGP